MPVSQQLEDFIRAVDLNDFGHARRQLKFMPSLAMEHSRNDIGCFVTGLQVAMCKGHLPLIEQLLRYGARMDLPIGTPPKGDWSGETAMTLAISPAFIAQVPNARQVFQYMARHHGERTIQMAPRPLLEQLRDKVDGLWTSLKKTAMEFAGAPNAPRAKAQNAITFSIDARLATRHALAVEIFDAEACHQLDLLSPKYDVRHLLDAPESDPIEAPEFSGPR